MFTKGEVDQPRNEQNDDRQAHARKQSSTSSDLSNQSSLFLMTAVFPMGKDLRMTGVGFRITSKSSCLDELTFSKCVNQLHIWIAD